MRASTFQGLNHQARLQLHHRRTGEHIIEHLPEEPDRGFALLPEPSPGDVWLDLEGDPWFEPARGLEYLFGWVELGEDGAPRYEHIWSRDRESEKQGFERLVDHIVERRRRFPGMHVYHYAPYERTALSRLMGQHGTREEEIDDLLRGEVLVDLFRVTKQALRASVPSYSIKEVEKLFGFERTADVGGGGESVTAFETWLETEDDSLLDGIRDYNEEDCVSLYELHLWLLERRPPEMPWRLPPDERERSEEAEERDAERARVRDALLAGAEEGDPDWLLAHLLDYHQREERPQWWEYFFHRELDDEELVRNRNTLGGLVPDGEPYKVKQSWWYPFSFEAQEHKIHKTGVDPSTERGFDVEVDNEHGTLQLRWGREQAEEPLPTALMPPKPLHAKPQRAALLRFAEKRERYPAAVEILERRPPRARLDGTLTEAALSLDGSYLFVQGPPGSGKTWSGARAALALMQANRRVGVTALSHKAIHKFLDDLEEAAVEEGYEFRGRKKGSGEGHYEGRFVEATDSNDAMLDPELQLLAGTSWLFAREELDQHVDTLFVDEGGQFALADAIAVGTAARNLVLLGDPNQLPQVSQGSHPPGAEASVLGHLLGDDETVPPDRGLFLEHTWRMRPEVNAFISETFYEGRLEPAEVTSTRSIVGGERGALPRRPAPGAQPGLAGGGGGGARRDRAPRRDAVRRGRRRAAAPLRRLHRRRAVQRARPPAAGAAPRGGAGRHGRQVPGPAGHGVVLRDGELVGRGRPARPRLPLLPQPPERRGLAGEVPGVRRGEPAAPGDELQDGGADAARERALPLRGDRGGAGVRQGAVTRAVRVRTVRSRASRTAVVLRPRSSVGLEAGTLEIEIVGGRVPVPRRPRGVSSWNSCALRPRASSTTSGFATASRPRAPSETQ